ncbi:MAG: GGDEF domain-containing protein, partial [Clostridia bacterium]
GDAQFSIIMVDVNNLKKMNDNYGHERGNIYLKNAADLIASVFGTENLYRIGGDEFVVVMEGKKRQAESTHLLREFRARMRDIREMRGLKPWEQVYAAAGIADYTQGKDTSTEDVLKRADMAMYTEKVEMKAARTE